eukprot:2099229-Rhodomonas_salina.3
MRVSLACLHFLVWISAVSALCGNSSTACNSDFASCVDGQCVCNGGFRGSGVGDGAPVRVYDV